MSETTAGGRECNDVLKSMDAFLDRTLPPESERQFLGHLDRCPRCAEELKIRRNVRARLQSAMRSVDAPSHLETRVRARLQQTIRGGPRVFQWAALAAMLILSAGTATIGYHFGHLRLTRGSREAYIAAVSGDVAPIMRVGLGDHVHCAVFNGYPKNPPAADVLSKEMGPQYGGLVAIVKDRVPSDYRIFMAHECSYRRRRFVHLTLTNGSRLMSLVIARKSEGESFTPAKLPALLAGSDIPIYRSGVQRFHIAAFETRDRLVYVISDLSEEKNAEMMVALAQSVKQFFVKLDG